MPTRVISDNLLTSKKVNQLKPAEFEAYIRILLCVDDFGFYSADPVEVARTAYPKRDDINLKQIGPILSRLIDLGLIVTYEVDGEPYLMVTNFINSPRAVCAKYPAPDGHMITRSEWKDGICMQIVNGLHADVCNLQADACRLSQIVPLTVTVTGTETVTVNRNRKRAGESCNMFARFWEAYPRKVGKPDAEKAYKKIDPDENLLNIMLAKIKEWEKSDQWQEENGKYIPYPATWLNKQLWESEIKPGSGKAQNFARVDYPEDQGQDSESPEELLAAMKGN